MTEISFSLVKWKLLKPQRLALQTFIWLIFLLKRADGVMISQLTFTQYCSYSQASLSKWQSGETGGKIKNRVLWSLSVDF